MSAPTLISYTETAWNTTAASKATSTVTWNNGDVVVALQGGEGLNGETLDLPTATGLIFVSQKNTTSNNGLNCSSRVSAVVASSGGSSAVTATNGSSSGHWGFGVWVWRNSAGIGNSAEQHTSTHTVSLTPTASDGAIVWGIFDFNVGATGSLTPSPTNTRQNFVDTARYTVSVADLIDQTSAGATLYGTSATGGPFSIVVLEIKASSSSSVVSEDDSYQQFQPPPTEPTICVW